MRYLVLLADREKAILLIVSEGKLLEQKTIFDGEVPQNVKAKKIDYGRDDKIFRHIEQHLHYHLQYIAKETQVFIKGKNISFIILGGHEELIPKMRVHLLYPLNKMVKGKFITELNIPINDVLIHSGKIADEINQKLTKRMRKTRQIIR
ncbi:hypothetical protein HYU93_00265 [Candidatus Daviesbacteria bacterium]|nr:hypothetical protein [Candidatus Daviesbacteria bacterium]